MPEFEEQIIIAAPAPVVFARLAQLERSPEWLPYVLDVRPTGDVGAAAPGPGFAATIAARVGSTPSSGTLRSVEWEPPRRLGVEMSLDAGITSTTSFEVVPRDSRCVVVARVTYRLQGSGPVRALGDRLSEPQVRRGLRSALGNLKRQLEAEAPRPGQP